jgi:CubicO group peptidase (beta-lactamase class C family)/predicted Ser/Thr protein kinase
MAVAELAAGAEHEERPGPAQAEAGARYELQRLLGAGGMGQVFVARDKLLHRDVAIKLLHENTAASNEGRRSQRRMLREARALAALAHPNVVAVFDQGVLDGRAFLAMEYVRGRTLRQWIAEEHPPLAAIVDVLGQSGRGLLAAHQAGLVHRDFKPDNVLVGEGRVAKVTDFGLARASSSEERPSAKDVGESSLQRTGSGVDSGTPAYMAPEQLAGKAADALSDQYAFAVTFYEAMHGARPDAGALLSSRGPKGDPDVARYDRILARALAGNPADRFLSMKELLAALEPRQRRTRTWLLLVALGALAALTALITTGIAGRWILKHRHDSAAPGLHAACSTPIQGCAAPLVCKYTEGNFCGAAEEPGSCGWPVDGCKANPSASTCGCDGVTYKNQCEAHRNGVGTASRGPCLSCTPGEACPDVTANGKRAAAFCHVLDSQGSQGASSSAASPGGVCLPRPSGCEAGGTRVCGWDGLTYPNACEARRLGTDAVHAGACTGASADGANAPVKAWTGSGELTIGTPDDVGMDARPLIALANWVTSEKIPVFSILVSKNGVLVFELYTSSLTREHAHYLMGTTGALSSALIGGAIDRHLLTSPEETVADALPASVFPSAVVRDSFRAVTIKDVLGLSAVYAPVPPQDESNAGQERARQLAASHNRVKFALAQPIVATPGVTYAPTEVTMHVATGIVEYATKRTALELAEEWFFRPMDFAHYEWMHEDSAGIDNGSYGLRLRPIDMQKFGLLYLQGGIWKGERLLSREWVTTSFTPWIVNTEKAKEPNYGWYWSQIDYGTQGDKARGRAWVSHVAGGWKGQRIAVFPDQGVVVTATGLEARDEEAPLFQRIVQVYVVPAVQGTGAEPPKPDPALRGPLAEAIERARAAPGTSFDTIEARLVPSVEPKETRHPFDGK